MDEIRFSHEKPPMGTLWPFMFRIIPTIGAGDQWIDVYKWCEEEIGAPMKNFDYSPTSFQFKRIDHAFKFKMRWC
jgi:hypothetical protein